MNKVDLAVSLASATGMTKAKSLQIVNATLDALTEIIASGRKVSLTGLGTFEAKDVAPRMGRNPRTGEEYPIPASRKTSFRASTALKRALENK